MFYALKAFFNNILLLIKKKKSQNILRCIIRKLYFYETNVIMNDQTPKEQLDIQLRSRIDCIDEIKCIDCLTRESLKNVMFIYIQLCFLFVLFCLFFGKEGGLWLFCFVCGVV